MSLLITGATGVLGSSLLKLIDKNSHIRVLTRAENPSLPKEIECIRGDLISGEGVKEAVQGIETVIHLATSPIKKSKETDVTGTKNLLTQAKLAGVKHFIYPSIIGIEEIPMSYYRNKLQAEQLITESEMPYTIVRATQFHSFIDSLFHSVSRLPLVPLPKNMKCQSVDEMEFANVILQQIKERQTGRISFAGPEIQTIGEMYKTWTQHTKNKSRSFHLPIPGKIVRSFVNGENTNTNCACAEVTWEQWLKRKNNS